MKKDKLRMIQGLNKEKYSDVETTALGGLRGVFASDVHVDIAIFHEGVVSVALKIVYLLARVRRWKSLLKRGQFTLLLYYGLLFLYTIKNPSSP